MQRDDHRLDGETVVRPEAEFLEPVGSGDNGVLEFESQQVANGVNQAPGDLAVAPPRGGVVNAPGHNRRQQTADNFRADAQGQRPLHKDLGTQVSGIDHAHHSQKRPEKLSTFPILSLE